MISRITWEAILLTLAAVGQFCLLSLLCRLSPLGRLEDSNPTTGLTGSTDLTLFSNANRSSSITALRFAWVIKTKFLRSLNSALSGIIHTLLNVSTGRLVVPKLFKTS